MRVYLHIFLSVLLTFGPIPISWAQEDEPKISIDFDDVELSDVVRSISEITGKNFIIGSRVRGKITVVSPTPVTIDEAYQVFLSALEVNGLCAVDVGKVTKIVPIRECTKGSSPVVRDRPGEKPSSDSSDAVITKVIKLEYLDAVEAKNALDRFSSRDGAIVAYGPSKKLIITDRGANIAKIQDILAEIDRPLAKYSVQTIPIRFADASDVTSKLEALFRADSSRTRRARRNDVEAGDPVKEIIPDTRTNTITLMATRQGLEEVLDYIEKIDVEVRVQAGTGKMHVIRLKHAVAEELAQILTGLISGASKGSSTRTRDQDRSRSNRGFSDVPPLPWETGGASEPVTPVSTGSGSSQGAIVRAGGVFEGEVGIAADPAINALIITASPTDYQTILPLILDLDVRRLQVFVETLIMEVNIDKAVEFGLQMHGAKSINSNYSGYGATKWKEGTSGSAFPQSAVAGAGLIAGVISGQMFTLPGTDIKLPFTGATFQALQTHGAGNLLSAPNILTTDNKEARISVGEKRPIPTTTTYDSQGKPVVQNTREDIGLELAVTPRINFGDEVTLDVEQKVEDVITSASTQDAVVTSNRSAKTTIVAQSGQTVVIGGLIKDQESKTKNKVPLLGDIPLVGYLFRSEKVTRTKQNLMIFLTPHVIRDPNDLMRVSVRKNNQRRAFNKKHDIQENQALYDYQLDEGLNMAPPPKEAEVQKPKPQRFEYEKYEPQTQDSAPSQEDILSERKTRRPRQRIQEVDYSRYEYGQASSIPTTEKKEMNPFADVQPPSSAQ